MVNRSGFRVDITGFQNGVKNLNRRLFPAIRNSIGVAGMQLMADATLEIPTTPIDEGTLRGSGSVHVEDRKFGQSQPVNGLGEPLRGPTGEKLTKDAITAHVGFNRKYATFVHEGFHTNGAPIRYSNPGSGAKFLERKMAQNADLYFRIIVNEIRRKLT